MKIHKALLLVSGVFIITAVSGCKFGSEASPKEIGAACWSPETKQQVQALTKSVADEYIETVVKADNNGTLTDEHKKFISDHAQISLQNFYVIDKNDKTGHTSCGANVNFTYTKPDNSVVHGDTSIQFDIYNAENGNVYTVERAPISLMINGAS